MTEPALPRVTTVEVTDPFEVKTVRLQADTVTVALRAAADWLDSSRLDEAGWDVEHLRLDEPTEAGRVALVVDLFRQEGDTVTHFFEQPDTREPHTAG